MKAKSLKTNKKLVKYDAIILYNYTRKLYTYICIYLHTYEYVCAVDVFIYVNVYVIVYLVKGINIIYICKRKRKATEHTKYRSIKKQKQINNRIYWGIALFLLRQF